MHPEHLEHFAIDDHNCFLNDCSITLSIKRLVHLLREEKTSGKLLES